MSQSSIELQPSRRHVADNVDEDAAQDSSLHDAPTDGRQEFSLPPVDGGKDAWLFLMACVVLEAMIWGFPFAFGVFQDYYRTHEPFAGSSSIAVIGTCAMGIMYLDIVLVMVVLRRYAKQARYAPVVGLLIVCGALALSSFAQQTWHLIATQGVLYAIGGSICYCPCILYMDEWFVRRKGFAFGMMWAGTGIGGFTMPPLLQLWLGKYGFRTTLRILSGGLFLVAVPLVYFIKPRLPPGSSSHGRTLRLNFVTNRQFIIYQTANILEALGFFLPGIYLPSYARTALGAGSLEAAMTVLILNVSSVLGCVGMGTLTDRLEVTTCIMISTAGATLGTFLLWGLAANLPVLYLFCVMYGVCAGAYTSTWPGIMRHMIAWSSSQEGQSSSAAAGGGGGGGGSGSFGSRIAVDPIMVFGILATGRGIGNVISGPLSEALISGKPWLGSAFGGYGSGYGTLIAFTGATATAGGASYVGKRIGWM